MNLPRITTKQENIVKLLYTYRYLDRIQLQKAMNHKDKRRVQAWLKDLREKHYVEWIYDATDFAKKTKPAIYYLGINGVRFLRALDEYPLDEVRKRYKDATRSRTFIDRSLLVADCDLSLRAADMNYHGITEAEYIDPDHEYHFLAEHEVLRPSLCIIKQKGSTTTNYLLEVFDGTLPRYRLRYRLKQYVTYLDDGEWEGDEPEPIVLLACANLTDLIYAKRATKKLIEDTYNDDIHIRFTTSEQLKTCGITAETWEEGRKRFGL
jgi:hypothetical protein